MTQVENGSATIKFSALSLPFFKNIPAIPPLSGLQFSMWRDIRRVTVLDSPQPSYTHSLMAGGIYLVSEF